MTTLSGKVNLNLFDARCWAERHQRCPTLDDMGGQP
jgi:hypothetical protein